MAEYIRQPVLVVLGHVDSGKTLLLDKIRGTAVQSREAGGITQHIGASFFPIPVLKEICGPLLSKINTEISVPGILVIDTPGHEVFTNLRNRGGSAADLAILVVDAVNGFEVQTYESIEILKNRKVPFVVALNKIDAIPGWRDVSGKFLTDVINQQTSEIQRSLDDQIYSVVGELSRLGFQSESYKRVTDFAKEIAIIPVSAKVGYGIPELIAIIIGLTQEYLTANLGASSGLSSGIVLELKEEPGLGQTADIILLDGVLNSGELIAMSKRDGPITAKIRTLLLPKPLEEMRDPRDRFTPVKLVQAAAGVKIAASNLDGVLAGSPFRSVPEFGDQSQILNEISKEIGSVFIETDDLGVVIKTDTIGSLEALTIMLKRNSVPIRMADIGRVSKRDVIEAATVSEKDNFLGAILAFGVKPLPDAELHLKNTDVKLFSSPIIYTLLDDYLSWVKDEKESQSKKDLESLTMPSKFKFLPDSVFRRSNPAIFGVEVISGKIRNNTKVMNMSGEIIGSVHGMQDKGDSVSEAISGMQIALSMNEPIVGRHVNEGDILYTIPTSPDAITLRSRYGDDLSNLDLDVLLEVIDVRRKKLASYAF